MSRRRATTRDEARIPRSLTAAIAATVFAELRIGASVQATGVWRALNYEPEPDLVGFEKEWEQDVPRWTYNDRCMSRARTTSRLVRGLHRGLHDLFVPVPGGGDAVLAIGPFLVGKLASADVSERWTALSGIPADLADHGFARYLADTLATLTLPASMVAPFERLAQCCAALLGDPPSAEPIVREIEALRARLLELRFAERMWEAARSMTQEQTTRMWTTPLKTDPLQELGARTAPSHAIVGLFRSPSDDLDPVADALRRHAAQRAAVSMARRHGDVICGKVGDRGVVLLVASRARGVRAQALLVDLATRARALARRHGFGLHSGIAAAAVSQTLASRYRSALAAAEAAFSRDVSMVVAGEQLEHPAAALAELRSRLADTAVRNAGLIGARFQEYVEAVTARTGGEPFALRAYLETGLEWLARPLLESGQLDRRSFDQLRESLDVDAPIPHLIGAYRAAVTEMERALERPTAAHQGRSVRRALAFMREHLSEPITLARVALEAGFAPAHLSRLLRRRLGVGFAGALQQLRLARARQALSGSRLSISRVAALSGFRSRTNFQRLFRERVGATPAEFRRRAAEGGWFPPG